MQREARDDAAVPVARLAMTSFRHRPLGAMQLRILAALTVAGRPLRRVEIVRAAGMGSNADSLHALIHRGLVGQTRTGGPYSLCSPQAPLPEMVMLHDGG